MTKVKGYKKLLRTLEFHQKTSSDSVLPPFLFTSSDALAIRRAIAESLVEFFRKLQQDDSDGQRLAKTGSRDSTDGH